MRNAVIALDPGNTYSGLAVADADATTVRAAMIGIERVRTANHTPYLAGHKLLRPMAHYLVRRHELQVVAVAIEHAPPTMRKDAPGAASRGDVGFKQAWLAASFCGAPGDLVPIDGEPLEISTSEWRTSLLAVTGERKPTRDGVVRHAEAALTRRPPPTVSRRGTDFVLTWSACGHETVREAAGFRPDLAPTTCPTCAAKPVGDPAKLVREAWKEIAVRGAIDMWPSLMEPVIAQAVGASTKAKRGQTPDPWTLQGVPDAAEAAWCAFHVVAQRNPGVCSRRF
jgi:hypothetical protein